MYYLYMYYLSLNPPITGRSGMISWIGFFHYTWIFIYQSQIPTTTPCHGSYLTSFNKSFVCNQD